MALEIAGVVVDRLTRIDVSEGARFVRHAVPGQDGDCAQAMGRPSVRILLGGIFYGSSAADDLQALRGHLLERAPVDFLCEITGQGYFAQVLLDRLDVSQRAGRPDEFDFECALTEFVPPPPPPASNPLAGLDAGLLDEAGALMDDMQNALAEVAGLADLLSGAADFANPTARLPGMLDAFTSASGGAAGAITAIKDLL